MQSAQDNILVELSRNGLGESYHRGHIVIMDDTGDLVFSCGDPSKTIFPRSSCKMLQALPLIESGAADAFGLTSQQLALACASHNGETMHVTRVQDWLNNIGKSVSDLRCGPQAPALKTDRITLHDHGQQTTAAHNNCSGKHSGFITLGAHIGGDGDYHSLEHPVQKAVKAAFEEITGEASQGYGIDGCSAPNFTCTMTGLARAAARMANAESLGQSRGDAATRLVDAMRTHPLLVSGTDRACADLMSACNGQAAIKTGAEGVFVAIIPDRKIGVALKIEDGATRAAETAIATLLVRLGLCSASDPRVAKYMYTKLYNFADQHVGDTRPSDFLWQNGLKL